MPPPTHKHTHTNTHQHTHTPSSAYSNWQYLYTDHTHVCTYTHAHTYTQMLKISNFKILKLYVNKAIIPTVSSITKNGWAYQFTHDSAVHIQTNAPINIMSHYPFPSYVGHLTCFVTKTCPIHEKFDHSPYTCTTMCLN